MGNSNVVSASRAFVLRLVGEAYEGKAWHGPNLRGSIRGLTAKQAGARLRRDKHSIAEIVVHCAYWKFALSRRLLGDESLTFPLDGYNWFALPTPLSPRRWKECVSLLGHQHRRQIKAIESLPAAQFIEKPGRFGRSTIHKLYGIALHDTFHAGQIRTIRGMLERRK